MRFTREYYYVYTIHSSLQIFFLITVSLLCLELIINNYICFVKCFSSGTSGIITTSVLGSLTNDVFSILFKYL